MPRDDEYRDGKKKLKEITEIKTFDELLSRCILSEDEENLLRMHYIQFKDLNFIADELNVSYSTIKRWHKNAIKKIMKTIK